MVQRIIGDHDMGVSKNYIGCFANESYACECFFPIMGCEYLDKLKMTRWHGVCMGCVHLDKLKMSIWHGLCDINKHLDKLVIELGPIILAI